jgi:hypothetical protein
MAVTATKRRAGVEDSMRCLCPLRSCSLRVHERVECACVRASERFQILSSRHVQRCNASSHSCGDSKISALQTWMTRTKDWKRFGMFSNMYTTYTVSDAQKMENSCSQMPLADSSFGMLNSICVANVNCSKKILSAWCPQWHMCLKPQNPKHTWISMVRMSMTPACFIAST